MEVRIIKKEHRKQFIVESGGDNERVAFSTVNVGASTQPAHTGVCARRCSDQHTDARPLSSFHRVEHKDRGISFLSPHR